MLLQWKYFNGRESRVAECYCEMREVAPRRLLYGQMKSISICSGSRSGAADREMASACDAVTL